MKKFLSLIIVSCMLLMQSVSINANEYTVVELLSVSIQTEYAKDLVDVVYREDITENRYIAEVVDKETKEVLNVYSEKPDISIAEVKRINSGSVLSRSSSTYNTTWDQLATIMTIDDQKIQAYVWVRVNITAGTYWRQVNYVVDEGHSAGGSGDYTLITAGTFTDNNTFPCGDTLSVDYNGVVEITSSNTVGFEFEVLDKLGFNISGSETTNWSARKTYNKTTSFTVWV